MTPPTFAETERRVLRVLDFIRDTVAEGHVSEPAGRGAGCSVDYDEDGIKAYIIEQLVDRPLAPAPAPLPRDHPADVVGYCWEANADHPRLKGKWYDGGGERLALGQRGPVFIGAPFPTRPWGLTQIWIMRNGQEVRATWKERP